MKCLEESRPKTTSIKTITLVKIILKVRMRRFMEFTPGTLKHQMVGIRN